MGRRQEELSPLECAPPPPPCRKTQTFSIWAELRASDVSCLWITGCSSLERTWDHIFTLTVWKTLGVLGVPRRKGLWAPLWLLSQQPPLSELYIKFPLFEVKREFCTHTEKGSKPREFPRVWNTEGSVFWNQTLGNSRGLLQCSEARQPDSEGGIRTPSARLIHSCMCMHFRPLINSRSPYWSPSLSSPNDAHEDFMKAKTDRIPILKECNT